MKRRTIRVPKFSGIYRIEVLDEKTNRWKEPSRGSKFQAVISYKESDGARKQKKCSFNSFTEAKEFRNNHSSVQSLILEQSQPAPESMKFHELVARWQKGHLPNLERSTQSRYRSYLKHFSFFRDMEIENIGPDQIDQWLCAVKSKEYLQNSNPTRCDYSHEFSVLKGLLKYYRERVNRSYTLPFLEAHKKALRVRDKLKIKKDMSLIEVSAFLKQLKQDLEGSDWQAIYYLAILQYAIYGRTQEAAALHVEDFDLNENTVVVNKRVVWTRAAGERPFIQNGLKAGASKIIPLSQLAKSAFKSWKLLSGVRSGPLFLIKGQLPSYRQIEKRYNNAFERAGLQKRGTYILRHASLTEVYESSKDILATREMAGHTDLKSTQRYTKVRAEALRGVQNKMDEKIDQLI